MTQVHMLRLTIKAYFPNSILDMCATFHFPPSCSSAASVVGCSSSSLIWGRFAAACKQLFILVQALVQHFVALIISHALRSDITVRRWLVSTLHRHKSSISACLVVQTKSFLSMFHEGVSIEISWSSLLTSTTTSTCKYSSFSLLSLILPLLSGYSTTYEESRINLNACESILSFSLLEVC